MIYSNQTVSQITETNFYCRYIGPMTIRDFTCMKLIATEKKKRYKL